FQVPLSQAVLLQLGRDLGLGVGLEFLLTHGRCSLLRGRFQGQVVFEELLRAFCQRGSVPWSISGLVIIAFGSGCTLNAAYTVVGAQTVSMKPTPWTDLPLNLRAKLTAS